MSANAQFRIQHVAQTPRGWKVRTKREGRHELRIAFPPGRRQTGAGKLIEILHPRGENPKRCNPFAGEELIIFGNPGKGNAETRFERLEQEVAREGGARDPRAVAAAEGRKKYGKKRFQAMALAGKRRAARGRKRNQDGDADAIALYKEFHGADPRGIVEKQRSAEMRKTYTAVGPLLGIGIYTKGASLPDPTHWDRDYPHIDFRGDKITLASNPEGSQLYAIGGNQNLESVLGKFPDADDTKDLIACCECAYIVYRGAKPPKFEQVEWMHEFGAPRPVLGFDRIKRELFLVGGRYRLEGNWLED